MKDPHHFLLVLGDAHGAHAEGVCVHARAVLHGALVHQALHDGGRRRRHKLLLPAAVQRVEVCGREHNTIRLGRRATLESVCVVKQSDFVPTFNKIYIYIYNRLK